MMNTDVNVGLDVGFLGLGQMGAAMAERLQSSPGVRLHVHDPVAEHMAPFVARGALAHGTARSVADSAPVVLACLPSPAVSLQVANEVAQGTALSVYVEMSTIGRPAIEAIAALLAPHRIGLVDAPVSGGPDGARAGKLGVMAAGDPAAVKRASAHLARIAGTLFDVGPVAGQAQAMKLINNHIAAGTLAVTAEALVAGAKAGLAGQTMIDVINRSSGQNNATRWLIPTYVLNGGFNFGATIGTMLKDVELALAEAASLGVAMPVNTAAAERWRFGNERLGQQTDLTRFVQVLEDLAQVKLRGDGAA